MVILIMDGVLMELVLGVSKITMGMVIGDGVMIMVMVMRVEKRMVTIMDMSTTILIMVFDMVEG